MRNQHVTLKAMTDGQLLDRLAELTRQSRRTEAELVAVIAEVDSRRLYVAAACSSMFSYCTEVLHLSEAEAFLRITAARTAREHPVVLEMIADGRLHLSAIGRLSAALRETRDGAALLQRAVHKTRRQIDELVAELRPQPDVPAAIRKLPLRREPAGDSPPPAAASRADRHPLEPLQAALAAAARAPAPPTVDRDAQAGHRELPSEPRVLIAPKEQGSGAAPARGQRATIEPIAPAR